MEFLRYSSFSAMTILCSSFRRSTSTKLQTMASSSTSHSSPSQSQSVWEVPGLSYEQMAAVAEKTFQRYTTTPSSKRVGKGVAIVWFRNDLRILDNEAFCKAWAACQTLLPVYCVHPRLLQTTHYFGFPKTGGNSLCLFVLWRLCCFAYLFCLVMYGFQH